MSMNLTLFPSSAKATPVAISKAMMHRGVIFVITLFVIIFETISLLLSSMKVDFNRLLLFFTPKCVKNNFLEYLISSGLRKVIPSLYNFSFSFTNLVLYYLFLNYFNLNPIIFLILSVITFGLIGKLNNFWNYLLFCVVYTGILSFGYYTNIGLLVTLALIAIFTVILILFSTFYKFEAPKERYKIRRKYVIAFPRLIFLNMSYLLFPLLFIWLLSVGVLLFFNSINPFLFRYC